MSTKWMASHEHKWFTRKYHTGLNLKKIRTFTVNLISKVEYYWNLVLHLSINPFLIRVLEQIYPNNFLNNVYFNTFHKNVMCTPNLQYRNIMESCAPGLTNWIFSFFFPFIEKFYPPVCSTMPASLQVWGLRQMDSPKG